MTWLPESGERNREVSILERWQCKIQRLRQFLRGWAKNVGGNYKKEKAELIRKADALDKKRKYSH